MRKTEITEEDIQQILNDNLLPKYWELQLGIGYVYENAPDNVHYSMPYLKLGELFWEKIKGSIHKLICDNKKPKEWVNDIITGDIRNLVVGLVFAITSKFDISMGIAIPIVALILKTGVLKFCSIETEDNDNLSISDIVKNKELDKEI